MSSARRILGPFNRVEGDLEVQIEIVDGRVAAAWVNSPLYRGFEQMLVGKDPRDALVITPRICGICSVSQSVAAARALAKAQGMDYTPNGRLATNLVLACENMADHLSHFYLFFMPDFARQHYAAKAWYRAIGERFAAQTGSASRDMLPARAQLLHMTGILAGKWPHSMALQPGGTTRAIEPRERLKLQAIITGFRRFLERTLFAVELDGFPDIYAVAAASDAWILRDWIKLALILGAPDPAVAQPAIGAVSVAMEKILRRFGLTPEATCGHSYGELTALYSAGWIDEATLHDLSALRGRLMAEAGGAPGEPNGAMLAVKAPLDDIDRMIEEERLDVVLANRNSPTQGVLSGPTAAIAEMENICKYQKINAVRLPVSAAFHSDQVKKAGRPFLKALANVARTTIHRSNHLRRLPHRCSP